MVVMERYFTSRVPPSLPGYYAPEFYGLDISTHASICSIYIPSTLRCGMVINRVLLFRYWISKLSHLGSIPVLFVGISDAL